MNDSPDNPEGTTRGPAGTRNNGKGQLQGQLQGQPGTGGSPVYIKFSLHAVVFFSSQGKSRRPRKPTLQRRDLTEESETPVTD